tara:strand:- start:1393 stop:2694 length:1302 start_codon:yes stop_codon:yes gene_type:complete
MMLAPQHFQQWERWLEAELRDRAQATATYAWGFTALELDPGALAGGHLAILNCAGLFADGTSFSCPTRDALPATRAITESFDDKAGSINVYLAVPRVVQGSSAYTDASDASSSNLAAMLRSRVRVVDTARPETDREIATAQWNLSLKIEGEDLTAYRTLLVARLVRAAGGGLQLAPDFTPPSLTVAASPLALSVLQQTAGMLAQKWSELSGKRRGGGGMADAAGLLMLHTAGDNLPGIRHCIEHGASNPENAYLQLARLASQMCSFHESISPTDIPAYRHEDPGPSFRALGDLLQSLLGDAAPSMCDTLNLEREGESMFWAKIPSPNMLTHGALYLSVRADASEDEIQAKLPTLTKISAKDKLQELLMRAIPGLPIRFIAQPPTSIPVQAGRIYFKLEPEGEHWDAISASLTIGIHASPGLPKLSIELLSVKQ